MEMEYRKLKDQKARKLSVTNVPTLGDTTIDWSKWKLKIIVVVALTLLTISQSILIVWSKRNGKYEYSITTTNFMVETLKCGLSLLALARIRRREGVTENNRLSTTSDEVIVYPIPALLYLVKNLLQHLDAPGYQILKNPNIISTGVLYRIILKKKLSNMQWVALIQLCIGCVITQLKPNPNDVFQTPVQGWVMAIVMALLSGFAGVYTEAIMKKESFEKHKCAKLLVIYICGLAVSMVMKYADNIVKFYSTSVAMLFIALVSSYIFRFNLLFAFIAGKINVILCVYQPAVGKQDDSIPALPKFAHCKGSHPSPHLSSMMILNKLP